MIIMTFKRMTMDGEPLDLDGDIDPNDWQFGDYSDRDDDLYDNFADLLDYNIRWEKDHND